MILQEPKENPFTTQQTNSHPAEWRVFWKQALGAVVDAAAFPKLGISIWDKVINPNSRGLYTHY